MKHIVNLGYVSTAKKSGLVALLSTQFSVKRALADSESGCDPSTMTVVAIEESLKIALLDFLERGRPIAFDGLEGNRLKSQIRREKLGPDRSTLGQDEGSLDDIPEFADVPGPAITHEHGHRLGRDDGCIGRAETAKEMFDE